MNSAADPRLRGGDPGDPGAVSGLGEPGAESGLYAGEPGQYLGDGLIAGGRACGCSAGETVELLLTGELFRGREATLGGVEQPRK